MKTATKPTSNGAEKSYLKAYARAMTALRAVENLIHDQPAPDGETQIHWGHVNDMNRIAAELESILPED